MPGVMTRPDVRRVLRGLRRFQRETVEYVFHRMYGDDPVRRFLVADEVGLGKTLVARGVIAKAVERLWEQVPRIDILYICSNASIARQNVSRLNITDRSDIALPSRITLLPSQIRDLQKSRLNFVSFTPGTSFSLRSSLGIVEERALLYVLLPDEWRSGYAAQTLFAGNASRATFERYLEDAKRISVNETIRSKFRGELDQNGSVDLLPRFLQLCDAIGRRQKLDEKEWRERDSIIGELRGALATSCIEALEPDLIILDEFQRFKHLLDGEDEASGLAKRLFNHRDARVLLLSATPYKMYTLDDESGGDDHFADFVQTLSFLHDDRPRTDAFKAALTAYRRELFDFTSGSRDALAEARDAVAVALRRVMVRTERLAVTADRNGMLKEVPHRGTLRQEDVSHYAALQRISRAVDGGEATEYWKSAPYLVNFMDEYDLKRRLKSAVADQPPYLYDAIASAAGSLLSREEIEKYRRIDPANVRLRSLLADLDAIAAWDVCWVPPSMPYYACEGAYARAQNLTKRLIFSSWQVVPKALASLLSYEAERRLWAVEGDDESSPRQRRERSGDGLRFTLKDGRPANMAHVALIYPSFVLAADYDPLATAIRLREDGGELPSLEAVLHDTAARLAGALRQLTTADASASVDDRWYWAAPILLDVARDPDALKRWLAQPKLKTEWRPARATAASVEPESVEDRVDAWFAHVDEIRKMAAGNDLGAQPADLAEVTASIAVAGFGVTALRALARVSGGLAAATSLRMRNAAGRIADAFLTLFNLPETEAIVRRSNNEEPYWRRVLEHAARGGLQAVLDEYVHVLVDALGQKDRPAGDAVVAIAGEIDGALRTRTANLGVDYVTADAERRAVQIDAVPATFRTRFAVRFGARTADDPSGGEREDVVRRAFNSPFWPFVLCSTSVGQEGLDFHHYCHAVVHWNVPSNPVDLEQREGRVHRYKNHAVRKNVAASFATALTEQDRFADPWREVFALAQATSATSSDLTPYWVFTRPEGAQIERHLPLIPLSADVDRAVRVRRALAVYRLAFGQSRQEDLVSYLTASLDAKAVEEALELFRIDLSPPSASVLEDDEDLADEPETRMIDEDPGEMSLEAIAGLLDEYVRLRSAALPTTLSADRVGDLLDDFRRLSASSTTPDNVTGD